MPSSAKTSIEDVDDELKLNISPNPSLSRVGSHFVPASDTERLPTSTTLDSGFGSLASVGRFCNDADDIIYRDSPIPQIPASGNVWQLTGGSADGGVTSKDSPVYVPWPSLESRCVNVEDDIASLGELFQNRLAVGSSLAPQSSDASSQTGSANQTNGVSMHNQAERPRTSHFEVAGAGLRPLSVDMKPMPAQVILPQPRLVPQKQMLNDPLRCGECGKTFHRRSDLIHHTRYHIRSSDRPYKCEECGHGFLHKKDLDRHMPRHTGQKLFRCSVPGCTKTYTRKDNLSRHIRHDHAAGASMLPVTVNEDISPPDSANEGSDEVENSQETDSGNTPAAAVDEQPGSDDVGGLRTTKRPADGVLERPDLRPAKRPPRKSPLKHRLACPYRKCKPQQFSSQPRYKVCATTPHEYMRRVVDHMDRNHSISVCGKCFFAFASADFLQQHKESTEHCTKCYLPFPNIDALSAHVATCKPVESSGSQEDAWQIMYETLCGDGVRHNPSFDHDGSFHEEIPLNNIARMRLIERLPPLPGQVNSLYKEITSASGNGKAPSVRKSDGDDPELPPATVGASPSPSADLHLTDQVNMLALENQQLRAREQQSQQRIASLQTSVVVQKIIGVVRARQLTEMKQYLFQPWPLPLLDDQSATASTSYQPQALSLVSPHSAVAAAWNPPTSSCSDIESLFQFGSVPSFEIGCPSLISDSTATSQDNTFFPTATPQYRLTFGDKDPNASIKEKTQTYVFTWDASSILDHHSVREEQELEPASDPLPNENDGAFHEHRCPKCGGADSYQWEDACGTCQLQWSRSAEP